jgi:hypothetical protein
MAMTITVVAAAEELAATLADELVTGAVVAVAAGLGTVVVWVAAALLHAPAKTATVIDTARTLRKEIMGHHLKLGTRGGGLRRCGGYVHWGVEGSFQPYFRLAPVRIARLAEQTSRSPRTPNSPRSTVRVNLTRWA